MKISTLMTAIFTSLVIASNCLAAYDIELKNGTVFVTDAYRIENGLVKFSYLNGSISIAKNRIASIKTSDAPMEEDARAVTVPTPADSASTEIDNASTKGSLNEAAHYKTALKQNQKEMLVQRENFRLAKENNLQSPKDRAWDRLTHLKNERRRIRREVLGLYNGTLPQWWHTILEKQQFFVTSGDRDRR